MSGPTSPTSGRAVRVLFALACLALVSVPFLVVRIPPITDLAQQMVQIPLAVETLSGAATEYRIQWLSPNKLSYPLLGVSWALFDPFAAVAMAMILTAAIWIGSAGWLAGRRDRPVEGAILSSLVFFNQSLYMGFLNFVVGLAAFMFWFQVVAASESDSGGRSSRSVFATALLGGLLLYYSHVLWLAMGLVWLGLSWVLSRPGRRVFLATLAGLAPTILLAAAWYPSLARQNWDESVSVYGNLPWERLAAGSVINMWFGGVHGLLEPLTMFALFCWALLAVWQNRANLAEVVDRRMLMAGALLAVAALLLPLKLQKTVLFSDRWMPAGAVFLLLALPRPRLGALLTRVAAVALVATFSLVTAGIWVDFEREELAGLQESLERLPEEPRLLGLDFVRESPRMKVPPYFQLPAYSQLLHGGRLGFSFVSLASSLVIKRDMRATEPWTRALEWHPQFVRVSDLDHFDFVLIHGPPATQAVLPSKDPRLAPVTKPSRWRLFEIERKPE